MTELKKDELLRANDVADLDPYNTRGKPKHDAARELIGEKAEDAEKKEFEGLKFTAEQREKLEDEGYNIFRLEDETLETLKEKGGLVLMFIENTANRDRLVAVRSLATEVAVKLDDKFFKGSCNMSYSSQLDLLKFVNDSINQRIPGVKAKIGEIVDYAQIYLTNNVDLVSSGSQIRTQSQLIHDSGFLISKISFNKDEPRINVRFETGFGSDENLGILPLIVPTNDRT